MQRKLDPAGPDASPDAPLHAPLAPAAPGPARTATTARPARVPGPRGLPYLGVALDYVRDPLAYLLRARERYGTGVVHLPMGPVSFYFVNEPELVEKVLVTDHRDYQKDIYLRRLGEDLLGQGLLTSEGDFWRRQRRLAQPAFHKERIAAYAALMVEEAERLAATLRAAPSGERRDVHADLMRMTLAIVTRTLFSTDGSAAADDVGRALEVVMHRFADPLVAMFPRLGRLPLPANRRFRAARARLDEIVYGFIRQRRVEAAERPDLLGMLLAARDEDGGAMSDRQLRDELITLFLAGHETTALALSYTLYLLAQHPAAERRLHAELDEVLSGPPTAEDLPRLRFTECVVLESMRLYPPAWAIGREALREVELGGHRLPAGAQVAMAPWVMHRDARHFPEPDAFRPERWEDGLARRLPRYAYYPFGGGPRLCIGREFAMLEAVLSLASLARQVRVRALPTPLRFIPSVTLRPRDPMWATFERRPPAAA
jgi:cytochrome P450